MLQTNIANFITFIACLHACEYLACHLRRPKHIRRSQVMDFDGGLAQLHALVGNMSGEAAPLTFTRPPSHPPLLSDSSKPSHRVQSANMCWCRSFVVVRLRLDWLTLIAGLCAYALLLEPHRWLLRAVEALEVGCGSTGCSCVLPPPRH